MKSHFFTQNRLYFAKKMDSIIILSGHGLVQRSNDASFAFNQEANFWYLTGIEAPDWVLVIEGKKSWLIAPEVDEIHQIFDGSLSAKTAKKMSGVDEVITFAEGQLLLEKLSKKHQTVATLARDSRAKYYDFALNPAPIALHRKLKKMFQSVEDCRLPLAKLRAIKQPEEISAIRSAISLTTEAFNQVKSRLNDFRYEYEIEAELSYSFRSKGAKGHAYDPIVASGKNACTLHYVDNNDPLKKSDLLLLDVGARVDGYPADIRALMRSEHPQNAKKQSTKQLKVLTRKSFDY